MGCGCCAERKARVTLENVRKLAEIYAKEIKSLVVLYRQYDGAYNFMAADTPEAAEVRAIEYISHL